MEAEAFARSLMSFVYKRHKKKNSSSRLRGCKPYHVIIGHTILRFHAAFPKFLNELSSVICPEVCNNEKAFYEFAETLIANCWRGYIFLELITMCSCIIYVAVCKFAHPRIMALGCKLIAICFQKLQWDFYAEGGWPNFAIYCLLYEKTLQKLPTKNRQLKELLVHKQSVCEPSA